MNKGVKTLVAKIGNQYVAQFIREERAWGAIPAKALQTKFFDSQEEAEAWGREMYDAYDNRCESLVYQLTATTTPHR